MKSISLFRDKGTWLNRMHPYTKLLYILAAILIPLIGGQLWLFVATIAVSIALLISGKVLKSAIPLLAFVATVIVVIFLIQGIFNHDNEQVLVQLGFLTFYKEGTLYATRLSLNIVNMLLSFAVFVLTTRPQDLVDELEKSGLSPKFGYIVNSVFQILPQMLSTKDTITDAQRSRGMETEGSLAVRMKAFMPLISPVVTSALINTRERAVALEVRGFGRKQKKTWIDDRAPHKGDGAINIILVLLIIATIAGRVLGWL